MLSLQQFSEPSTPTWQTPIPPFPRYQLQHIGGLPVLPTQCTMERKYHFLRVCFLAFGCVSSFSLSSCGLHLLPFLFFLKNFLPFFSSFYLRLCFLPHDHILDTSSFYLYRFEFEASLSVILSNYH
jgi:hypothetical protein